MSLIQVSNLTFGYDGSYDIVFDHVSFQMDTAWKLGFCGRNGRGKTTFLRLLMGEMPYQGTIQASVQFEYFPYPVRDLSIHTRELLNNICGDVPAWQLQRELNLLLVSDDVLDRPFGSLSPGERTKTLLAALFLKENGFPLIDEPTNHLDVRSRALVADYLHAKSGFILVSHDRAFLDASVDHIVSLNRNNIDIQRGNFTSWYQNKERQDAYETAKNAHLKKDIRRLTETAREKAAWSDKVEATKIGTKTFDRGYVGHMAAKAMKRSKTIERRVGAEIEAKDQLLRNIDESEELKLHPLSHPSKRLVECRDLSLYYADRCVCGPLTFAVERGDHVALTGANGCGKSSILKLLTGQDIEYTGNYNIARNLTISYVSQETAHLAGALEAYEDAHNLDVPLFRAILRKLAFSRAQFDKPLQDYSQGQKKKVLLARSLSERAHLYIWDEPLNYVDVLSRIQIEELLACFQPTLLFVEHDRTFVDKIVSKTIQL